MMDDRVCESCGEQFEFLDDENLCEQCHENRAISRAESRYDLD